MGRNQGLAVPLRAPRGCRIAAPSLRQRPMEIDVETDQFGNCVVHESGIYEAITIAEPQEAIDAWFRGDDA